jgi:ParB-like chromosome segregation protein Spo0J
MPMKKGFLTVEDMSTDEKILALTIERNIITERLAVIIEALARLEAQRETH